MINTVLDLINNELNEYLKRVFVIEEDKVSLNNMVNLSGDIPSRNKNKLILSLVNLEPETSREYYTKATDANTMPSNPPLSLNLTVLLASLFEQYYEDLTFLSKSIIYFHKNPVFIRENTPNLPANISKISIEIISSSLSEMHDLWTSLGTNYRPSTLLKVRVILLPSEMEMDEFPAIEELRSINSDNESPSGE